MKKIILLTFAIITISCTNNNEIIDDNIEYQDIVAYKDVIIDDTIEGEINFMPIEVYKAEGITTPKLQLKLATKQFYGCVNYGISYNIFKRDDELIIRFNKIKEPTICLTATGPATAYIDLPETFNKITFINGKNIDTYNIAINTEKVSFTTITNNFTNSLYNHTFRIPQNSFAFVCGTNTNNTHIYTDFLTILRENPNFTEFEFNGEGRIPYQETSSGNWVNHPSKYFTYTNNTEFENLDNILDTFTSENIEPNTGVTIAIFSWNNQKFYSWD